jgi:hypothetical protein
MTEQDWLASADPGEMLWHLQGRTTCRKLRLLVCASCRRCWELMPDDSSRAMVEVAERLADGHASESERMETITKLAGTLATMDRVVQHNAEVWTWHAPHPFRLLAALAAEAAGFHDHALHEAALEGLSYVNRLLSEDGYGTADDEPHANLIRCIFGNPFTPLLMVPESVRGTPVGGVAPDRTLRGTPGTGRTPTALKVALAIYNDRAWDHLPILADLLEENGCREALLLEHLRGPGPHCEPTLQRVWRPSRGVS